MRRTLSPASGSLRGRVVLPGDKSLSHRAVLFAAMAEGTSRLTGVLDSADVRSTIAAVEALGARIELAGDERALEVAVTGWGARGPAAPSGPIDCGNSGTTARLLAGVVAGWPIEVTLTGDASLSRRPMGRVAIPLTQMGAAFSTAEGGTLPMTVRGAAAPSPIAYSSPVASAQVKTAVLLAGLRGAGRTSVAEPALSRDHTERLLPAFGVDVGRDEAAVTAWVDGPATPRAAVVGVPGDPSSAAFMVVAALIVPGSDVTVKGVSLNPTRIGFLRVLERMGADVTVASTAGQDFEPVGAIRARRSALRGTVVEAGEVPSLVDEVPILAVAAARAEGTTRFEGVGELRVKESDRLAAIVDGLAAMGVTVRVGGDWLEVDGPARLQGAVLDSLGDHRLAMSFAVAALAADGDTAIDHFESVAVSYPSFMEDLDSMVSTGAG